MPKVKLTKSTVCASDAAATASAPRRPIMARSVVIIAIWPSCVSAIGTASFSVSESSIARWRPGTAAGVAAAVRSILSSEVMAGDYHRLGEKSDALCAYPPSRAGTRVIFAPSALSRSSMRS